MTVLTADIARSWLSDGVPSRQELEDGYNLHGGLTLLDTASGFLEVMFARTSFLETIAHAVPCREAIEVCVQHGPIVEVGAGTGFWSALIDAGGGDIIATDVVEQDGMQYALPHGAFHTVERLEASEAVARHPDRNVLCVWPCYGRTWASEMARRMAPGKRLLLVGEMRGGCCADDGLFDVLDHAFEVIERIMLPRWPMIKDSMAVYEKKEPLV